MKGVQIDTIYLLGPILSFLVLMYSIMVPLIDNISDMNNKLVAFSECSGKTMDFAFLGKTFNFSKCYLETISKNLSASCYIEKDTIICYYKNKTYSFLLNASR